MSANSFAQKANLANKRKICKGLNKLSTEYTSSPNPGTSLLTTNNSKNSVCVSNKSLSSSFSDSFDLFVDKRTINKCSVESSPKKTTDTSRKKDLINSDICKLEFPCPLCFRPAVDLEFHLKYSCEDAQGLSGQQRSTLINAHVSYCQERIKLGLPLSHEYEKDIFKEFKPSTSYNRKECSNREICSKPPVLKWKKKCKKENSVLLKRTAKERESIITQKVAIVLMMHESVNTCKEEVSGEFVACETIIKSQFIREIHDKACSLWKSSSTANTLLDEDFYVVELSPTIYPISKPEIKEIPNDEKKNSQDSLLSLSSNNLEKGEYKCEIPESCMNTSNDESDVSVDNRLEKDWKCLFGKSDFSDVTVLLNGGDFKAHKLVFFVRARNILADITFDIERKTDILSWKELDYSLGISLLKYVYFGEVCDFDRFSEDQMNQIDLFNRKYRINSLDTVLKECQKILFTKDVDIECRSPDIFAENKSDRYNWDFDKSDVSSSLVSTKRKIFDNEKEKINESIKKPKWDFTDNADTDIESMKEPISNATDFASNIYSQNKEKWSSKFAEASPKYCTVFSPHKSPDVSPYKPKTDIISISSSETSPIQNIYSVQGKDIASSSDEIYKEPELVKPLSSSSLNEVNEKSLRGSLLHYFDETLPLSSTLLKDSVEDKLKNSPIDKQTTDSPIFPILQSTPNLPNRNIAHTPSPQVIISDYVTPPLDYSKLISPDLQGELKKYGLKRDIDKRKAKALLRYIYDQIHPVLSHNEAVDALGANELPSDNTSTKRCENGQVEQGWDEDCLGVRPIKSDSDSESDGPHLSDYYDEFVIDGAESVTSEKLVCSKEQLLRDVSSFIKSDRVLFESILRFVPVWLNKLHQALKQSGIKCSKNELMDVLDELCVTFRTERKTKRMVRKKRRVKTQLPHYEL